jgi:rhodanese-related sulfurtransferase
VRPPEQYSIVNIPGSINISSSSIVKNQRKDELDEITKNYEKVYIMCRRGNASRTATRYLLDNGYENVFNVRGGITEYVNEIDDEMPMY